MRPDPDPRLTAEPTVDWDRVSADLDRILSPRPVQGPIVNRGQARTGGDLWGLSLRLEQAHDGSEGDKARAREYVRRVVEDAKRLDARAQCRRLDVLCRLRTRKPR